MKKTKENLENCIKKYNAKIKKIRKKNKKEAKLPSIGKVSVPLTISKYIES